MMRFLIAFLVLLISPHTFATGYDVFGIGIYDIKFDGSSSNEAADLNQDNIINVQDIILLINLILG